MITLNKKGFTLIELLVVIAIIGGIGVFEQREAKSQRG
jgi:prepilin-type N-terminal cleavage/methylation domain-containing protein